MKHKTDVPIVHSATTVIVGGKYKNKLVFNGADGPEPPPESYIAKSIILDIADNYGYSGIVAIRSVDFYFEDSLIAVVDGGITCYSTTVQSGSYLPSLAFITALSKVGTNVGTGWASLDTDTNQRLICVFDTPIEFDYIVINNYHESGLSTTAGIQNVVITLSSDAITSTAYEDTITNPTVYFDSAFRQHFAASGIDNQIIPMPASSTLSVKSIIIDIADNYGNETYMGIRSIDVFNDQIKSSLSVANCTCYNTSTLVGYPAANTFYTATAKTGTWVGQQWLSADAQDTNQRIICVLDSATDLDLLIINNSQHLGGFTDSGAQNIKIITSTDAITDTTYNAAIANSTVIFDGVLDEHVASDVADRRLYDLV